MAKKVQLNRIGEILEEKGVSQHWLAAEAGVNQSSLSLYITGQREPGLETIYKLAKALKVDPCDLLNR
jgi:putative transcriptional regulator